MDLPVVTYFEHQVPKVVRVLRKITVRVFEHLGITTWKCIDHRWMFIEQVLLIPTIYTSITCHSGKEINQGDKDGGSMCFSKQINYFL